VKHWRSDKLQGKPEVLREKYEALPFRHHISEMNCCGALASSQQITASVQHYLLAHLPEFKLAVNNPFKLLIIFLLCM